MAAVEEEEVEVVGEEGDRETRDTTGAGAGSRARGGGSTNANHASTERPATALHNQSNHPIHPFSSLYMNKEGMRDQEGGKAGGKGSKGGRFLSSSKNPSHSHSTRRGVMFGDDPEGGLLIDDAACDGFCPNPHCCHLWHAPG